MRESLELPNWIIYIRTKLKKEEWDPMILTRFNFNRQDQQTVITIIYSKSTPSLPLNGIILVALSSSHPPFLDWGPISDYPFLNSGPCPDLSVQLITVLFTGHHSTRLGKHFFSVWVP